MEKRIDNLEDDIAGIDPTLLSILLKDKTTRKNILWCTKDYEAYGPEYNEHAQIRIELITGIFLNIIQPRAAKSKAVKEQRIKKRAEVFTPSWICNEQNNQVDEAWFRRKNVFNTHQGTSWITTTEKIEFGDKKKNWKAYVNAKRLEITCGEAPYLVSRYDTTTGELIPVYGRIGLFDRKMRIVNENCNDSDTWIDWSIRAVKSVYGYEFQGDSVLIARQNLLYDYMDYYKERFRVEPPIDLLIKIANIIAWNIWQMDGLRCVVPYSCNETKEVKYQMTLFDFGKKEEKTGPCPGCEKNNLFMHTGTYCRIFDWTSLNKSIPFIDVFKEDVKNEKI
ncbi:restriction endonuclease subunit M [Clostridium senegalense]|uniref:Restriction endonuclease subunit M n=1 Tax=Clostridium senegalense TaxID=1465809 RepID=A0A6M0GZ85_9CLOT|nr:restriction endonuclease subunit M [Clostridium senegalense]